MTLQAEVHCYHCGDVSGVWEWAASGLPEWGRYRGRGTAGQSLARLSDLRCLRCRGPVFLDEITRRVERAPIILQPARRGRPRKSLERLAV
jgi:hypothetical protein